MIICTKCGRKFKSNMDVPLLVEVQTAVDDVCVGLASDHELVDIIREDNASYFRGCPDCLTNAYLKEKKSKYKRKYRRGGHILSMDELIQQDFVYWHNKITPRGWFMSWQIAMASRFIGQTGCIYYAIKNEE